MNWKSEYKSFLWILGFFLFAYFLPVGNATFGHTVLSALALGVLISITLGERRNG